MRLDLVQPGLQDGDQLGAELEDPGPGVARIAGISDQARLQKLSQMPAHHGRRDPDPGREFARPVRTFPEQLDDPQPGGIRQSRVDPGLLDHNVNN